MRGLAGLVRTNLKRGRRAALLSAGGIAAGVAALVFFLAAGQGVGRWIREGVFPQDSSRVEVVPPKVALGFLGGQVRLDEEALERLRNLPGVEAAHRKMEIRVPAVSRYDGAFFGQRLRMGLEIVGEGVDAGLLGVSEERWRAPAQGEAIPVAVSSRLLEIYNKSFARARGLPTLTPQLLIGFEFPVEFGRSYVGGSEGKSRREAARLETFSSHAMLQGITLPLEVARQINRHFGKDDATYSAVVLQARSPDFVPALVEAVRGLGFEIDEGERQLAERLGAAVAVISGTLALLGLFIVGLAGVNIALALGAQVRGRSREIGVMRALGATPGDIARIVLGEALAIGLVGALAGLAAAWGAAALVDAAALAHLPDFPFKPATFFHFSVWIPLLALGVGVGAALLGAWPPARRASRLDPSRAMSEPV